MLGRASNIGDYVKRGEESGWIKISLRGNKAGETITITRKIDRQNKSEWQLNGMSRNIWFKIQFAYICTFSFILVVFKGNVVFKANGYITDPFIYVGLRAATFRRILYTLRGM